MFRKPLRSLLPARPGVHVDRVAGGDRFIIAASSSGCSCPAVQKVREAGKSGPSARTTTSSKSPSAYAHVPRQLRASCRVRVQHNGGQTWAVFLLPFIEQGGVQRIWSNTQGASSANVRDGLLRYNAVRSRPRAGWSRFRHLLLRPSRRGPPCCPRPRKVHWATTPRTAGTRAATMPTSSPRGDVRLQVGRPAGSDSRSIRDGLRHDPPVRRKAPPGGRRIRH